MTRKILIIGVAAVILFVIYQVFFHDNIRNEKPDGSAIVAFGDSLTSGFGAPPGEDYPSHLSRLCNCEIINKGISGETTAGGLARLEQDVIALDPKIVILGLGANDMLRSIPVAEAFSNLREMVTRIQEEGALVILMGVRGLPLQDTYGGAYKTLAEETGCVLVPNILGGILTNPKLKSDQIHPNAEGYKLIAERVWAALKPYV